jgi:nucleoside-diphosphate-sugar epimerase
VRVLILGGTGLMGGPSARAFLDRGHEVVLVTRGSRPAAAGAQARFADRADAASLAAALSGERFDVVVDLLAYDAADVARLFGVPDLRFGRYLVASTGQVYLVASERTPPFREEDASRPAMREPAAGTRDHGQWTYGVGKRAVEAEARARGAAHGVPVTALRLPVVQGAGDPSRRLWAYLQRLLDGGPLLLPEGGEHPVRFVWAGDAARAFVTFAEAPPAPEPAYNVAQPDEPTLREFVTAAASAAGVTPRFVSCSWDEAREAGLDHQFSTYSGAWCSRPDPARAKRDLGFEATPYPAWLPGVVRAHLDEPSPAPHPGYALRPLELALAARLAGGGGAPRPGA